MTYRAKLRDVFDLQMSEDSQKNVVWEVDHDLPVLAISRATEMVVTRGIFVFPDVVNVGGETAQSATVVLQHLAFLSLYNGLRRL